MMIEELEPCWNCDLQIVSEMNAVGIVDEGDYSAFICPECGSKMISGEIEGLEHIDLEMCKTVLGEKWVKAMEKLHEGPLSSINQIEEEEERHRNIDPNHGYDLDYIAEASQENALEDAMGWLCWDSVCSEGPHKDLGKWLEHICEEHRIRQYPTLIDAFVGFIQHPEPVLVYCAVTSIGIIAKDTMCTPDQAIEDFTYNYQDNLGATERWPVFIEGRNKREF